MVWLCEQNVTKILFMTVFYAPFYPNGFFFSAITLVVVYWMDKFCLFVSLGKIAIDCRR